jgi:hypothetical protein
MFITLTSAFNPINRNAPPKLLDFVQSDFLNQVLSMSKSSGQNLCPMCKNVMTTLKSSLSNPTIKTDVTRVMSQLCTKMVDNSYQQMCNLFVSSHLPSLLDSVVNNVNPEAFCDTFEVCQSTSPANPLMLKNRVTLPPQEIKDIECVGCKALSVFVLYGLLSPDAGKALGWQIAQFCLGYIGDPTKQAQCLSDADQISEIFPLIPQLISPAKICGNLIKVCPPVQ